MWIRIRALKSATLDHWIIHRDDEAHEPPEPGEDVRHLRREVALLPRTGTSSDYYNKELKKTDYSVKREMF